MRTVVIVCTLQEHLESGSDEVKVHQITINYWSFPLLVHFAAGLEAWLEAPVCGEVLGTLVLCGQLCLSCSTNCVIEKLFDFSLLSQTLCILFRSIKGQELGGTMGVCRSPGGTMALPGPRKKTNT